MLASRRGDEAVSPNEVGYLACLSGRKEAGAMLLGRETGGCAETADPGLEARRVS
jgi:hypothetical protein